MQHKTLHLYLSAEMSESLHYMSILLTEIAKNIAFDKLVSRAMAREIKTFVFEFWHWWSQILCMQCYQYGLKGANTST